MKQKPLRTRLLAAIVAVSFAAIILCVVCFALMLNSAKDLSLRRGRETNDELIDFVMHGFTQNEAYAIMGFLRHAKFAVEAESFADDDAMVKTLGDAYVRGSGDFVYPDAILLVAREGRVTAAAYASEDSATPMEADEAVRLLHASDLASAAYEPSTLEDLLTLEGASSSIYSVSNPDVPLMVMLAMEDGAVLGAFVPSASSQRLYEAIHETALEAQQDTADALQGAVSQYIIILVVVGGALLLAIALLAVRLSRAIAEPVEREKRMMEQVNQLKSEFLANVSHELKTPLTVMSSHAQHGQKTLAGIPEAGDAEHGMRLIAGEADRLALMVTQVLDVTQIDEGHMALDVHKVALPELIQTAMDTYYPVFSKNGNTLLVEPSSPPPVLCDAARVTQVLVNLVSNAAKHTFDGTITIRAEQQDDMVRVSVADTGEGIAPEEMARLFERYRTKKAPGDTGTGLGLYISRHIVEAHGGQLAVESEVGRGTTAAFTLPVA